ncbi:hypothetical protein K492DRAFT_201577 [Lichtheimia hyalospora FSU 10163]|nr:hypothetical protein K492DRAFT_201577 [Lichtheimia hyalospora FSU 10163]
MLQEDVAWDQSFPRVTNPYITSGNDTSAFLESLSDVIEDVDLDMNTFKELNQHYKYTLMGLKEFIKIKHQNLANHYGNI